MPGRFPIFKLLIYFLLHIDVFLTVLKFLAGITLKICEFQVRLSSKNYTYSIFNTLKKHTYSIFDSLKKYTYSIFSTLKKYTYSIFSTLKKYTYSIFPGTKTQRADTSQEVSALWCAYRSNYKLLFQELASDFRAVGKCS